MGKTQHPPMSLAAPVHPRAALFEPSEPAPVPLPVCDHYAGVEPRMRKSLELQAELGPVFDVTLDGEDGAPVGGEIEHAHLMAGLVGSAANRHGRVGVRLQAVDHPKFEEVVDLLVGRVGARLPYLMIPKPRGVADVDRAAACIDAARAHHGLLRPIPLHALVETHGALREVQALAAHPRIESLSFGLMDFVSAHRGAIPLSAMGAAGQFDHPLVVRAKLEIAAACHAHGKTPSHCVVTEFTDQRALEAAVHMAKDLLGYTRMWSIHPSQIRPILQAFAPQQDDIDNASKIIAAAAQSDWAPISFEGVLHDRASYRFYWQILERAHHTGRALPPSVRSWFGASAVVPS